MAQGIRKLYINNVDLYETYGIWVSNKNNLNSASRDNEFIRIPGRQGGYIHDHGGFNNITIKYDCYIRDDLSDNLDAFRASLMSGVVDQGKYMRIRDSMYPDLFRFGRLAEPIMVTPSIEHKRGRFTLTFDCRPERFYVKYYDDHISSASSFVLEGPDTARTCFPARPLICWYYPGGTSVVDIGAWRLTATGSGGNVYVDCDTMETWGDYDTLSIQILSGSQYVMAATYPQIMTGTQVTLTSNATNIAVTPRWWKP